MPVLTLHGKPVGTPCPRKTLGALAAPHLLVRHETQAASRESIQAVKRAPSRSITPGSRRALASKDMP